MKNVKAKINRSLPLGAIIDVVDNSGARRVQIISVKGYKTRTRKLASAGVGDLITGSVISGKPDMRHKLIQAVVVRQKKEYVRADGTHIRFEDNASVVLKDVRLGTPKGTTIKGPISKEAAIRWSQVAKMASIIL